MGVSLSFEGLSQPFEAFAQTLVGLRENLGVVTGFVTCGSVCGKLGELYFQARSNGSLRSDRRTGKFGFADWAKS
jgi:hypothetical protein